VRLRRIELDKRTAKAVQDGHPWVFADALPRGGPRVGEEVELVDRFDAFLGRGLAEGRGPGPAIRVLTRDPRAPDLRRLVLDRLDDALSLRRRVLPADTDAYRLLHGEGDGLPGLVVDRYGPTLVLRPDSAAWAAHRPLLVELLSRRVEGVDAILHKPKRGDVEPWWGEAPESSAVLEAGRRYRVRPGHGQKTGFFLDQRDTRTHVQGLVAAGDRVLNLFSFTGGFTVAAALGGAARVVSVDLSASILDDCREQLPLNDLPVEPHGFVAADLFEWLPQEARRREAEVFDVVICDPPALARKGADLPQARDAYRRLHEALAPRVARGGLLVTCSCTARLGSAELLEDARAGLAAAGRSVRRIVRSGGAGGDHPVLPELPGGGYLSALTLVLD
jgi:23S rRNA (cytosine1962-C5)-methyltransferase